MARSQRPRRPREATRRSRGTSIERPRYVPALVPVEHREGTSPRAGSEPATQSTEKLGLPPRKIHRVYADERRANTATGELFFTRRRSAAEIRKLQRESFEATPGHRAALDARRRVLQRGAVEAAPTRLQGQLRAEKLRYRASELLPGVTKRVESTHGARIREEVRMDAVARQLRGGPALDEDSEIRRRIHDEAVTRVAQTISESKRLGEPDAEKVARLLRATFPHPAGAPRPRQTSEPASRRKPATQERDSHRER